MNKIAYFLIAIAVIIFAAGCSAAHSASYVPTTEFAQAPAAAPATSEAMDANSPSIGTGGGEANATKAAANLQDQKIIRNAALNMETKHFDAAMDEINDAINKAGGYVEICEVHGKKPVALDDGGRSAMIVARIPAGELDSFLLQAKNSAEVINQRVGASNVSEQYTDLEARKKSMQLQLDTLSALVEKSQTLDDVLALESEIARVRYELETVEGTLRGYDRRIQFSEVTIDLSELTQTSTAMSIPKTYSQRMAQAFDLSIKRAVSFAQEFSITLVSIWPAILLIILIAAVALVIFKSQKRKIQKPVKYEKKQDDNSNNN